MLRILIVCTGNTCRSPMAEALLKDKIERAGLADRMRVLSAGLAIGADGPASAHAKVAMKRRGLNLDSHRTRPILPEYITAADIVLTMTTSHKKALIAHWPQLAAKIHTLAEFAGEAGDVSDPYGGSVDQYQVCAAQIENLLDKSWPRLVKLAGENS